MVVLTPQNFADAIAQEEQGLVNGQLNPNTVGMSANNPLNLEMGDVGYGTVNAAQGQKLTVFATLQDGWNAALNMLNKDLSGNSTVYQPTMTLQQYMQKFTGSNSANAGNTVASVMGVSPNMPLTAFGMAGTNPAPVTGSGSTTATAPASSSGTSTGSSFLNDLFNAFVSLIPGGNILAGKSGPGSGLVDIVAIAVGLMLLAGMVFGFKNVTTTVVKGVKSGAELASA